MKTIGLILLAVAVAHALIFCLPLKIRLLRKYGPQSNDFIIQQAKLGDSDAKRLHVRTKIGIVLGLFAGFTLLAAKYNFV